MSSPPDYAWILFDDICDIIGHADEWPSNIRQLFWSGNVTHFNRLKLCDFVAVNGLNPEVFHEWIDVVGLARDLSALNEFKSLLHTFTTNPEKWNRACAFHVLNYRYEYISEVKWYLPMSKRHN